MLLPTQSDRLLTTLPVQKLTDILSIRAYRKEKDASPKRMVLPDHAGSVPTKKYMIIISEYTLVLNPENRVFC